MVLESVLRCFRAHRDNSWLPFTVTPDQLASLATTLPAHALALLALLALLAAAELLEQAE